MKKFLIANKTQKQKLFSLYNGTLTAVQPGEFKIICMFDERAITEYTKIATDSWVNGIFITCNPKIMNTFTMDDVDVTPIQDANVKAVGTDDIVATNTEDGVNSTDVSTDTEDSNDTDDNTAVTDSETEDTDVDTTTPDSEEDSTSEEDNTSEEDGTSNTVTDDTNTDVEVDDTTAEYFNTKSLTELRTLCEEKGINAKRFTKTQCITELTKTPADTD